MAADCFIRRHGGSAPRETASERAGGGRRPREAPENFLTAYTFFIYYLLMKRIFGSILSVASALCACGCAFVPAFGGAPGAEEREVACVIAAARNPELVPFPQGFDLAENLRPGEEYRGNLSYRLKHEYCRRWDYVFEIARSGGGLKLLRETGFYDLGEARVKISFDYEKGEASAFKSHWFTHIVSKNCHRNLSTVSEIGLVEAKRLVREMDEKYRSIK